LNDEGSASTHGAQSFISEKSGVPIRIGRLEDELTKRKVERVALWKLDVEGYEVPALEGAKSLLKNKAIDSIYAELHGSNGNRVREYLSKFGYYCYWINESGRISLMKTFPEHTNGLFLSGRD